jgi:hypothetical protein
MPKTKQAKLDIQEPKRADGRFLCKITDSTVKKGADVDMPNHKRIKLSVGLDKHVDLPDIKDIIPNDVIKIIRMFNKGEVVFTQYKYNLKVAPSVNIKLFEGIGWDKPYYKNTLHLGKSAMLRVIDGCLYWDVDFLIPMETIDVKAPYALDMMVGMPAECIIQPVGQMDMTADMDKAEDS